MSPPEVQILTYWRRPAISEQPRPASQHARRPADAHSTAALQTTRGKLNARLSYSAPQQPDGFADDCVRPGKSRPAHHRGDRLKIPRHHLRVNVQQLGCQLTNTYATRHIITPNSHLLLTKPCPDPTSPSPPAAIKTQCHPQLLPMATR